MIATEAAALRVASAPGMSVEKLITKATATVVVLLVAALVVVIWVSVFTRYVTDDPIAWGEQVAKYFMIWAAFLGASLGLREGAHIAVNLLVEAVPRPLQKVFEIVAVALTAAFLGVCLVYGALFTYKVRDHSDPLVWEMPMSFAYAAIPAGCLLMLVQLFFVTRRGLRTLSSDTASLS